MGQNTNTNTSMQSKDTMQKRARSINKSKWIDRDSSLLMDGRGSASGSHQFDNSFIDQEDKMRVHTPGIADSSMSDLMKKRHNSTER